MMMKLNKSVLILLIMISVVFLFGCQKQDRRNASKNIKASEASKEMDSGQTQKAITSQDTQTQEAAIKPAEKAELQESNKEAQDQNAAPADNSEAQEQLMFAQRNLKLAQKGILSYSQAVALSRNIIKDYPGTEYAQQAQEILRQVPIDQRDRYKLTEKELGLHDEKN